MMLVFANKISQTDQVAFVLEHLHGDSKKGDIVSSKVG